MKGCILILSFLLSLTNSKAQSSDTSLYSGQTMRISHYIDTIKAVIVYTQNTTKGTYVMATDGFAVYNDFTATYYDDKFKQIKSTVLNIYKR